METEFKNILDNTPDEYTYSYEPLVLEEDEISIEKNEGMSTISLYLYGLIPVVVLGLLYFLKPRFIKDREKKSIDKKKLISWTIALTLLGYLSVYLLSYYNIL